MLWNGVRIGTDHTVVKVMTIREVLREALVELSGVGLGAFWTKVAELQNGVMPSLVFVSETSDLDLQWMPIS
jgi:hypothetical protein